MNARVLQAITLTTIICHSYALAQEQPASGLDPRSAVAVVELCEPFEQRVQALKPDSNALAKVLIENNGEDWVVAYFKFYSDLAKSRGLHGEEFSKFALVLASGTYGTNLRIPMSPQNRSASLSRLRSNITDFLIKSGFDKQTAEASIEAIERVHPVDAVGKCISNAGK